MRKNHGLTGVAIGFIVAASFAMSARAQVSATGTVTATPSGGNYLYTINLTNTGSSNIETFWFSWLPDNYDFLPSVPTPTGAPANWTDYVETGYYGSSIQWYDTGSSPILPGHTNSSFQFLSPDAPSVLQGNSPSFGLPVTYSYVYSGVPSGPLADPTAPGSVIFSMAVTVPEPAGLVMCVGGAMSLLASRRRKHVR